MDQTLHELRAADFPSQQKNAFGKESWRWPYQSRGALQRSSLGQKVQERPGEMLAGSGCCEKWPGALTLSPAQGNTPHWAHTAQRRTRTEVCVQRNVCAALAEGKVIWGTSASCLVSSMTKTIKKGGDSTRVRKHLFRKFCVQAPVLLCPACPGGCAWTWHRSSAQSLALAFVQLPSIPSCDSWHTWCQIGSFLFLISD